MQFLQDLIGLSYFHFYPAIEQFLPPGTKNQQLYRAIRDGEVTTDEEARRLIYGNEQAGKKYNMLKKRLKQQVADHYFQLLSKTDDTAPHPLRHRMDHLKQLTIAHTLVGQGRYVLARQLLYYQQKAAAAQLDLVAVQEGLQLLRRMAGYQDDRPAFRRYDAQLRKTSQRVQRLREAQGYYEAVRLEHRRHWPLATTVATLAQTCATKVPRSRSDHQPVTAFYGQLLKLIALFHGDKLTQFRRVLSLLQQHIERHPALATYDPVAQADLLAMEYLSTPQPEGQSRVVQQIIQGSRDESLPAAAWVTLREVECIHWLRTGRYDRAERMAQQLVHEETLVLSAADRGRWVFFQAYASYLRRATSSSGSATSAPSLAAREVDLQSLLNDAAGYGWQWALLKMLLWLEQPFMPARPFLSQLDAYAQRHLARQSERTTQFFRHLRTLIAHHRDQKPLPPPSDDTLLPPPTASDHLRELVPYELLLNTMAP